ncbi:recombination-associated protein RdgC [Escherichia coli]|uniref:recombination-associated protein RdgC n=1 Tax=Escherichia coli TaxID=562 RepID=UPI00339BB933
MEMVLSLLKRSAKQKFFRRLSSELFKLEKLEQEQARKLKKTEKDSLKDKVVTLFCHGLFESFVVIQAIYDGSTKRIYINASAAGRGYAFALTRKSLASLPVVPLKC